MIIALHSRRHPASLVSVLAATALAVSLGATPAGAGLLGGDLISNYDPGVSGTTIQYPFAYCGIVLYELPYYQGKKLCGVAPRNPSQIRPTVPLSANEAARFGGDMDWRNKVSSVTVRPGTRLDLYRFGQPLASFYADTPNLGSVDNLATEMDTVATVTYANGNNNEAVYRPVFTINAVSCNRDQGPEKAVDNSVDSIYTNKWCAWPESLLNPVMTLQVDLGADKFINGVVIHHAGDGPLNPPLLLGLLKTQRENDLYNTIAYKIKVSSSPNGPWVTAGSFMNTYYADVSNYLLRDPVHNGLYKARYVQLEISWPSFLDDVARIEEFEVLTFYR